MMFDSEDDELFSVPYVSPSSSFEDNFLLSGKVFIDRKENHCPSPISLGTSPSPKNYSHFSLTFLENCPEEQLVNFCRIYNIKPEGERQEMIDKILESNFKNIRSI